MNRTFFGNLLGPTYYSRQVRKQTKQKKKKSHMSNRKNYLPTNNELKPQFYMSGRLLLLLLLL